MTGIFALHYYTPDFFRRFIECFRRLEDCEIHVIENHSANTLREEMFEYIRHGLVKKYALFDRNIAGMAKRVYFEGGNVDWSRYDHVVMTESDIIPDDGWLDECKAILDAHPEILVCSVGLYMDNLPLKTFPHAARWIPAPIDRGDHYETITGEHCMTFRTQDYLMILGDVIRRNVILREKQIHNYGRRKGGKIACTKTARARHLTWDLYQDPNHPYTRERIEKPNAWDTTERCGYEVIQ